MTGKLWNALIKTHHVTSRKKVARLRKAARDHAQYVLLRSGGAPGIMYIEGHEQGVNQWVGTVAALRYKDYQLVCRPSQMPTIVPKKADAEGFEEVGSVHDFAQAMSTRGLLHWWRAAMGYTTPPNGPS